MYERQRNCDCFRSILDGNFAPEAAGHQMTSIDRVQLTYTSTVSSQLLLWAGYAFQGHRIDRVPSGGTGDERAILEQSTGYNYGGYGISTGITRGRGWQTLPNHAYNFTATFLKAAHTLQASDSPVQGRHVSVWW
jgi:hypothetical protein